MASPDLTFQNESIMNWFITQDEIRVGGQIIDLSIGRPLQLFVQP